MSNVQVRSENANRVAAPAQPELDPFRLVRRVLGWDPFAEMAPFFGNEERSNSFLPAFEVKETKAGYVFKADVPGVREGDLDITVTGNRMTVSGKRELERQEQGDRYYAFERSYGTFSRSFTLPDSADMSTVQAELKDGVLTVAINRKPEMQPTKVQIRPQTAKS